MTFETRPPVPLPGDLLTLHYCFSCHPRASDRYKAAPESVAFRQTHQLVLPELAAEMRYINTGAALSWPAPDPEAALLRPEEVPRPPEAPEIGTVYGAGHHALDHWPPREAYGGGIAGESYTYLRFALQGTKIGGYPPPIQTVRAPLDSAGTADALLATFGSIQGSEVEGLAGWSRPGDFQWGDMGCFYVCMTESPDRAETAWFRTCYRANRAFRSIQREEFGVNRTLPV